MARLSDADVQAALGQLPGWAVSNGMIVKTYTLPTFPDAITFVNGVAELAEERGHHPDIDIRYNRVTFALVTHDQGGITDKDVDLANAIESQSNLHPAQG